MSYVHDTIAAVSSPPGAGARGIVRLSGPDADGISRSLCDPDPGRERASYSARHVRLSWPAGRGRFDALLLSMRAPCSYTREDVAELHLPGSPPLLAALLEACFRAGARPAGPGEFTYRAFLNGRVDLTRAEAVNKLIRARNESERRAAVRELGGRLDREITRFSEALTLALSWTEARLDFSDQDFEPVGAAEIRRLLEETSAGLGRLLEAGERSHETGSALVLLAGRANAGKSTLFNALMGAPLSIVTPHPGTTRDVVTAELRAGSVSLLLGDPAGLGGGTGPIADKARTVFERWRRTADWILVVLDSSRRPSDEDLGLLASLASRPGFAVLNKADLPLAWKKEDLAALPETTFRMSAHGGEGVAPLRRALISAASRGGAGRSGEAFGLNARQRAAAARARGGLEAALRAFGSGDEEIAALEIREAVEALGRLSGRGLTETVLEEIFSRFCVGK